MDRILRLFPLLSIALVIGPATNFACSCVPNNAGACSGGGSVAFIGRVIRDTGAGLGSRAGRMIVEQVLHGLSESVREVDVDSSSGSSCYVPLGMGERWVIYGGRDPRNAELISTGGCSGSFPVRGNELRVEALLAQKAHEPSRIVGIVRESTTPYGSTGTANGLEKPIKIVAEREGQRLETLTLSDGQFEFRNVTPGAWRLRPDSAGVVHDAANDWPRNEVVVPVQGCVMRRVSIRRDGHIRGVVRSTAGTPIRAVPVQVFSLDPRGKEFDSNPFAEAVTDENGAYDIGGLPPQQYIVGINAEPYSDKLAYAPHYFGGTSERQNAKRVDLKSTQPLDNVDLVLPPPRLPASLVLKVEFPDGRPARSTGFPAITRAPDPEPRSTSTASITDLKGRQRAVTINIDRSSDGTFRFPLWRNVQNKSNVG